MSTVTISLYMEGKMEGDEKLKVFFHVCLNFFNTHNIFGLDVDVDIMYSDVPVIKL